MTARIKSPHLGIYFSLLYLFASLTAYPAIAQEKFVKKRRVLEEVIVTANKIEQGVQDIPGSVQALTGDFMQKANITDFNEVTKYLPNTKLIDDGIEPTISIRGVKSVAAIGGGDNSVGLVIDDLALSRQVYFHNGFFDLERIEVLRGPQGTLFGKSTTAGVMNIVSASPTDEFSGFITLRQGEYDQQAQLALSGPLTDTLSARIAVLFDRPGSDLTNSFNGDKVGFIDRTALRIKLRWEPTENNTLSVFWNTADVEHKAVNPQFLRVTDETRNFLEDYDPNFETDGFDGNISFDFEGQTSIDNSQLFGARLDTDWGERLLFETLSTTVVLGGSDLLVSAQGDLDISPADILRAPVALEKIRMSQLEARVQGTTTGLFGLFGGDSEFITGFFAQKESVAYDYRISGGEDTEAYFAGPGAGLIGLPISSPITVPVGGSLVGDGVKLLPSMETLALGLFTQFTYRPIERLAITLGLRYDHNNRDSYSEVFRMSSSGNGDASVLGPLFGAEEDAVFSPEIRERKVSSKLSLQYDFFEGDLTTYATFARGYKGGAFNFFALSDEDVLQVDPELVDSIEIGVKTVLLENSLSMNVSIYDSEFTDLHVYLTDNSGILPFIELANAAKARTRGVEFDAMYVPQFADWLTLSGALAYSDAFYEDYENGPGGQDFKGKPLSSAPDWSGVFTSEFSFPMPMMDEGSRVSLAIDATYSSEFFSNPELEPDTEIDEALLFNARLSVEPTSGTWDVTLSVSNLADSENYASRNGGGGIWEGALTGRVADGRKASLDLGLHW